MDTKKNNMKNFEYLGLNSLYESINEQIIKFSNRRVLASIRIDKKYCSSIDDVANYVTTNWPGHYRYKINNTKIDTQLLFKFFLIGYDFTKIYLSVYRNKIITYDLDRKKVYKKKKESKYDDDFFVVDDGKYYIVAIFWSYRLLLENSEELIERNADNTTELRVYKKTNVSDLWVNDIIVFASRPHFEFSTWIAISQPDWSYPIPGHFKINNLKAVKMPNERICEEVFKLSNSEKWDEPAKNIIKKVFEKHNLKIK